MGKAKFDGSLESVLAAADAALDDNPRSSGKQLREVLAGLKVDIPTVEGSELVVNDDGSIELDGSTYVPADLADARAAELQARLASAEQALSEAASKKAAKDPEPLVGTQALAEAADKLDEKPLVRTTNGAVARWLRSL